jgi:hypothetical protein
LKAQSFLNEGTFETMEKEREKERGNVRLKMCSFAWLK